MRRVRPISHEDEVSLVEHLDELRARIVVSLSVFGVAFALCFWQNHLLLELASGPLPSAHDKLITFGITEPFTTTMTVAGYGAIILSMPIILFEIYGFYRALTRNLAHQAAKMTTATAAPSQWTPITTARARASRRGPRRAGSGRSAAAAASP